MPPTTHDFYTTRAAEARSGAAAASLDNVRERWLKAASAWDAMAARVARTDRMRRETDAKKAAEREALELLELRPEPAL